MWRPSAKLSPTRGMVWMFSRGGRRAVDEVKSTPPGPSDLSSEPLRTVLARALGEVWEYFREASSTGWALALAYVIVMRT